MGNQKNTNTITSIKELFDGEEIRMSGDSPSNHQPEPNPIDKDLQAFLDEREEFRGKMHEELSIDSYMKHYDKICRFGLDEYFIERLHWHISLLMDECEFSFFKSEFYRKFKKYKTVKDIIATYDFDKFNF